MALLDARNVGLLASLTPMALYAVFQQAPSSAQQPDFARDILPIFKAHCSPCHNGGGNSGGLKLDTYEQLMAAGVVTKGSAKKSILIERILGLGGLPRMPMGFKPLSEKDTATIERWIDAGAKPPRAGAVKKHWAFVPPQRPKLPPATAWTVNPIDRFVLARLRQSGMAPSQPADKTTLIRRVTLDLIGLPPTPSEVNAFLADRSPNAYEKVVDRLLASPHYGERMALPWLDAARYADSNGFQQDGDTFQYVWRDWVVKALNDNMPFDRFTIEQLAGDLLPKPTLDQLVATGFNRNHMLNGEGGAIPEEQRNVNLFDRVDTTATTWLSLTMSCARCHDHKYDPLSQRDYYSMMAYFNQVPETGVPSGSGQYRIADPWVYAGTPDQMARVAKLERAVASAKAAETRLMQSPPFQQEFENWRLRAIEGRFETTFEASSWFELGTFKGQSFDEAFSKGFGPERGGTNGAPLPNLKDGETYPLNGDNTAFYFGRDVRVDRDADYLLSLGSDDGVRVYVNGNEVLTRKVTRGVVPDSDRVVVRLAKGLNRIVIKIVNGGGIGGFNYRAFAGGIDDKTAAIIREPEKNHQALIDVFAASSPPDALKRLRATTGAAQAELARLREGLPRVMVMSDAKPRKTYIYNRGNYEEPTDLVTPSTPTALPKSDGPKNRMGLARWIVSPTHPLTARVQVNRAWQLFFGRGLVRTEENFGIKGEPPSHPELLDWLAVDFRENGWNVKRLHKMIVMSNTYRQSSKISPALLKKDPANILLGRAPRFRLPSPILRDIALSASGLLDPKLGGKPVYPYQPKGIWDGLAITLERDFTYPQSKGADNHRRSLYTFWRRTVAPGNMFDTSSRQVCTVKPTITSTPLQALTMLNDITWVEAGRALAAKLKPADDKAKLAEAFRRVCARRPNPRELAVLSRALASARSAYRSDPASATAYLSQGEYQPETSNPVELAAWSAVCTAIFNLDEAMTRE